MKLKELAEKLIALNPEAQVKLTTDGIAGPFVDFEVKAVYDDLVSTEPLVQIVLKRVV